MYQYSFSAVASPAAAMVRYPQPEMSGWQAPNLVQSWYLVCRSAELPRGRVLSRDFLGRPIVLFRTQSGAAHALSAHCSHMGTHLGLGEVTGECLRCPLHRWEYDGDGLCRRRPLSRPIPVDARQFSYPVEERYGGLFLFNAPAPLFPLPAFTTAKTGWQLAAGRPVFLRCPWYAVGANVFDMEHLQSAHDRALREPPQVEQPDPFCLHLRYAARVTGGGITDRLTRWLTGDQIRANIHCWGGTILTAENNIGRARAALLLAPLPVPGGVQVTPIFGVRQSRLRPADLLRVRAARWLISGFLARDVRIMDGMRFRHSEALPEDAPLRRYLEFVQSLPPAPPAPGT